MKKKPGWAHSGFLYFVPIYGWSNGLRTPKPGHFHDVPIDLPGAEIAVPQ